ncbi:ATP-binding protein [Fusobacterium nucleatum]|uniref:ATP-binding protein n=1 Tax=Fusobacterium nucleatum TaxID=851 RepID=UPI0025EAF443|nr:ATP-binding protein [uncultured Fusobacterium sp.]
MRKVKFTLLSIKNIYSLIKINIFKKDFLINILWIFLLSLIFFYSFSISFKFYFSILLGVWIFLTLQYPIDKNENWYIQFIFFSIINSISFYLVRYFQKKNFLILSIKILITYYLILFCIILFKCVYYTSKTNLENDGDLFVERKYDLERLLNYLNYFSIIGINGEWGSGKSFLTDHLKNFILIKIDLLSCNVDEIQTVILNELDKLLKNQGIFSPFSPKLKKILQQGKLFENISQLFVKNDISYSEAITGLHNNLKSINKPIVIVYEDLDRVENTTVIKQILGISEKIAGDNIKILYQFSETNLLDKGIERTYLEKYIPFILNLTDIPFKSTLSYVLKQEIYKDSLLDEEDFKFLYLPVYLPHFDNFNNLNRPLTSIKFELKNVTIRKTQLFLNELNQVINEKEIYKKNKRVVILFFLLKHFYYEAYKKISSGESLLDTFTFLYQDKNDTVLNWVAYCHNEGINILDLMTTEDNKLSAFIISIFEYNCDIETINNDFEDFVNEARNNLKNKNLNEQKDRIIWNLIGNGKSEYTDCEKFVNSFYNEVIDTSKTEWIKNFNKLWGDLYNRKYKDMEKRDNYSIFRLGISSMVSLFQANYVIGRTGSQWIKLIDFYFLYNKNLDMITPELIECLYYCELSDRNSYLYIINKFNNLKITKNLNLHKSYKKFLLEYLSMFSTLGFCDTYDTWDLREQSKEYIDVKTIEKNVFLPLKKKLENLFSNVQIKIVQKDIEILIKFLDKNIELVNTPNEFNKPALFSNANWSMRSTNQEMVDKLNQSKLNEKDFEKEVIEKYMNQEITASEVSDLERYKKDIL